MKPNKAESKKLALIVTKDDLHFMFKNAYLWHTKWEDVSNINLNMTKGSAFNILKGASPYANGALNMGVVNAIREFGEYLPTEILAKISRIKKTKRTDIVPFHQEPIFEL